MDINLLMLCLYSNKKLWWGFENLLFQFQSTQCLKSAENWYIFLNTSEITWVNYGNLIGSGQIIIQ